MQKVYITNVMHKVLANGRIKYLYGELCDAETHDLVKGAKLSTLLELVESNPHIYEMGAFHPQAHKWRVAA